MGDAFEAWLPTSGTNCPSWFWLAEYDRLYPYVDGVVLDVGCNVGYSSAKLLRMYATEYGFGPSEVFTYGRDLAVDGLPADQTCGACNDCKEDDALTGIARPGLVIHCFEPSKNHFQRLLAIRSKFMAGRPRRWQLHNVAISNTANGMLDFPAEGCGELCAVSQRDAQGLSAVGRDRTLTTDVDSVVRSFPHGTRFMMLKIDTEGHDVHALTGAGHSIKRGVFDIITFEYGTIGDWADASLSSVVSIEGAILEGGHYACFYDGKTRVFPMSDGCFDERMDAKSWSNKVCVNRRLEGLLEYMFNSTGL